MPYLVSLTHPNLQILGKTQRGVFPISGQSLLKENYNSRSNDDIEMKLGPATKLDKRNKLTSIKFDNDVMSLHCNIIVIFPVYGQFRAIRKPDSGGMVC